MPLFLITYDLRAPGRNYDDLHQQLRNWNAVRVCESVWLAELVGPASTIRDLLGTLLDSNDLIVVIQQFRNADWAAYGMRQEVEWLQLHMP